MRTLIHQIFYDEKTRQKLLQGVVPLDNSASARPDWFEFWVILNYLRKNPLDEGTFYGFLSPRFQEKTGFTLELINDVTGRYGNSVDVVLLSHGWDQISYFANPFEQGEAWHPGLLTKSQRFLDDSGISIDLRRLVCDSTTTVFSNYVVAKKKYWTYWQELAERFFDYAEKTRGLQLETTYGTDEPVIPIKVFIQERLSSIILSAGGFKALALGLGAGAPIFTRLFDDDLETRKALLECDQMKRLYRETGSNDSLARYWSLRAQIKYYGPRSQTTVANVP